MLYEVITRNIKHGNMGITCACELLQETDIAFDSGHKSGFWPGFSKSQLMQGTDTIRITVEYVEIFFHGKCFV